MNKNIIAIIIGIATSVMGGYLYTYLLSIDFPLAYALGAVLLVAAAVTLAYVNRGKVYLLFRSSIKGYYPDGQRDYIDRAVKEILRSKMVTIVGARGTDLTGEGTSIGSALRDAKQIQEVEIFLLKPQGEHSRLRSDHLEVERQKYTAESESVDAFFGVLKLHEGRPVRKFSYDAKPRFRMVITDFSIFVCFYQPGTRGRDLPCWHVSKKPSVLQSEISSYIEYLKGISTERNYNMVNKEPKSSKASTKQQ